MAYNALIYAGVRKARCYFRSQMDKKIFRRLVLVGIMKNLTLSVAGMIDCAVVGRYLGADGLSAMKLAMPVFSILGLFSSILSTGLSVSAARDLTRGEREKASRSVKTVFTVSVLIAAVCMLVGFLCPSIVTSVLAGDKVDETVFSIATDYLGPILISALPILLYDILGSLALLEGADKYVNTASIVILVLNIAGDILAKVFDWKLTGIAAASGASYLAAFLVIFVFFLRGRSMFKIRFCKPDLRRLFDVTVRGLPMIVKGLCGILWPLAVNRLMLRYGTIDALAALSIQDAIHYLPAALCSGIASATLIMTGIYAGEEDRAGLRKVNQHILGWSLIGGTLVALSLGLTAQVLLKLFTDDPELLALSVSALRLYLMGVPFLALNFSAAAYLQGVGQNKAASLVIFLNHILLSISAAFVLGRMFNEKGIFASYGVCEIAMVILLLLMIVFYYLRQGRKKPEGMVRERPEVRQSIGSVEEAVEASKKIHTFCLENGITEREAFTIALCTEELAVNSIEHGFNDGKKHHLEMRAVVHENNLLLRLRDDCRRFDLVERYKIINPDDPTKNIGLRLIFKKADDVSYSSALSMNNVCVKYMIRRDDSLGVEGTFKLAEKAFGLNTEEKDL